MGGAVTIVSSSVTVNGTAAIPANAELQVVNAHDMKNGIWSTYLTATTLQGAFSSLTTDDPRPGRAKNYLHREGATDAAVGRFAGLFITIR